MNLSWRILDHWRDAGLLILRAGVGAVLSAAAYPILTTFVCVALLVLGPGRKALDTL
jgi:hypothetical protein